MTAALHWIMLLNEDVLIVQGLQPIVFLLFLSHMLYFTPKQHFPVVKCVCVEEQNSTLGHHLLLE